MARAVERRAGAAPNGADARRVAGARAQERTSGVAPATRTHWRGAPRIASAVGGPGLSPRLRRTPIGLTPATRTRRF